MKDLFSILGEIEILDAAGEAYAMATLVKVSGSTYRGTGARMLITTKGSATGTISGGCLESDVRERAKQVIADGKPQLVKYETTADEDILWGTGMGCRGVIYAFIDCPVSFAPLFRDLSQQLRQDTPVVLATVFDCSGDYKKMTGQRLLFDGEKVTGGQFENDKFREAIIVKAVDALRSGKSTSYTFKTDQGHAEVFIEFIGTPISFLVFGGGHDVHPLLHFAKQLEWRTTIIEHRPAFVSRERFPEASDVQLLEDGPIPKGLRLNSRTVCVVMTHNYLTDKKILKGLLCSQARYIGMLGPTERAQQLLSEIQDEGADITEKQLEKVFSPVGLDIGADNADEIALAIIAEILAVIAGRNGGFLRERKSAIHNRRPLESSGVVDVW